MTIIHQVSPSFVAIIMFDIFKNYLTGYAAFSSDELSMIEAALRFKKIRKHQYLLQQGDICRYHYFVAKGLLRTYSIDEKGNELVLRFAPENGWISDCESLYLGTPSQFNIDAIEDTAVILFENNTKELLMEKIPSFGKMINTLKNKNTVNFQNRLHESLTSNAEQKYHNFVAQYPALALRVPQHMIASYLGIKPETLSRIRSKR